MNENAENEILIENSESFDTRVNRSSIDAEYEKSLSLIGFGKFHLILLFVCALANASDAIEILCISFVMPSAQCDLQISTPEKGILSSMTFVGMMIGGFFWGTLSDVSGRKYTLFFALMFNAVFAIFSGLSQTYVSLLVFRFLSGIGVGGSVPIVWSYFSEFIAKNIRGRMICTLASSWLLGNLLVIFLAYMLLNRDNMRLSLFAGYIIINDWRIFMIACAIPSLITALLVLILPESPKFCLFNRRQTEAKKILVKIYNFNHRKTLQSDALDHFDRLEAQARLYYSNIAHGGSREADAGEIEVDDLDAESQDRTPLYTTSFRSRSIKSMIKYMCTSFCSNIIAIFKQTKFLFQPKVAMNTYLILFIMFALCFGYYGLWIWLPELYKRMDLYGGSPCRPAGFNSTEFLTSGISLNNNSPNQTKCHIENKVFLSSFYSAMSNLPGNLFTIFFIDKMGRNIVTSLSLILSGLSVFGIPFIHSESEGVILATIFGGINVITFNSFGCTATELYPTKLRSTALGVQFVAGRLGAILGNILFGLAVDLSCYIPLLTVSGLLVVSGLVTLKLPESKNMNIG